MDYRHHFFAGQRIARTTLTDGANPFVYCGYDPMNRTDADGGGGAGLGKITKPPVLWHVQIQKPDMSGPTLWDAIVRLFTGASSSSSSSDESAEKEGEPEGKKKVKKKGSGKPATQGWPATRYDTREDLMNDVGPRLKKKGENTGWEHLSIAHKDTDGKWFADYPTTIAERDRVQAAYIPREQGVENHFVHNHFDNNYVSDVDRTTAWGEQSPIYVVADRGVQCFVPSVEYSSFATEGTYSYMEWGESSFSEGPLWLWYE